jgi:hypothetical protein
MMKILFKLFIYTYLKTSSIKDLNFAMQTITVL